MGEEWLTGPYGVLTSLASFGRTLRTLDTGRSPLDGRRLGRAPEGRMTVEVLPHNPYDGLLLHGLSSPGFCGGSVRPVSSG